MLKNWLLRWQEHPPSVFQRPTPSENWREIASRRGIVFKWFHCAFGRVELQRARNPVVKVSNHGRHVMNSSPVPLTTRRVGERYTLTLPSAQTSSHCCGVAVRKEGVPAQTIRNVLHEESYYGRAARKKSFISERNRRKRLDFAKSHVNLSDEFWNTVIFSDESKFNIFGSDGRQYVWRKPNTELEKQHLTPTVKHGGGSVLVWGCMAANGVGKLRFIDGIMTARTYINILRHNLQSSAQKLGLETSFVFQQDNDPEHTANFTREWLLLDS
ncbi:transposable element Tc1 transposase [Trichonephila clavipes]|nr:transposable element Tc1 transposase [Trichonephila clavipes]